MTIINKMHGDGSMRHKAAVSLKTQYLDKISVDNEGQLTPQLCSTHLKALTVRSIMLESRS